ncbi:MAG: hypothetical protein NUV83_00790 [Candidatus Wolfebacteria bacterium]|nr:hypothetical protein [Candidatus Wolfebacteria bacterium]
MSLEDLEKNLYGLGRKKESKKESEKETPKIPAQKESQEEEKSSAPEENQSTLKWSGVSDKINQMTSSPIFLKVSQFSKVIFWLVVAALIIAGSFAGYYLSQYLKTKDFVFEANAPSKVLAGQPFEIKINIENKSKNTMRDSLVDIQIPEGVVGLGKYSDRQVIEENIGTLESGDSYQKSFSLAILDTNDPAKKIDVYFSYLPPNLNTKFEKKQTIEIFADQPAVGLNLSAPQKVFSGEQFEITASYKNLSDHNFSKVRLEMAYPAAFKFKESSPAPTSSNNIWITSMPGGIENNVSIKGSIVGPDSIFFDVKAKIFIELEGKEYPLGEKTANLGIASSPLSLSIIPNNDPNFVAFPGDTINYSVSYGNNTEDNLQDAVIKVKVSGVMFDLASYRGNGFFDSNSNTVIWNASQEPGLKNLSQGAKGTVSFSFKTKTIYPIKKLSDKNFSLKAEGEISSPTVPYYISSDKTVGVNSAETKIGGRTEISAYAGYNKKGPYPPQVNKPTRYLVHWIIKNYVTDKKDVKIKAVLQSGASWTGTVTANIDTDGLPTYNERTQEVSWDIARVIANKGVIGKPIETTFEIEIAPSISQANALLPLLSAVQLTASDEFTGLPVNTGADPLQTVDIVRQ